jgi:hypothetical protein
MTEEEQNEVIARMLQHYGENLPNPEHQPIVFNYLSKIYLRELRIERSSHEFK